MNKPFAIIVDIDETICTQFDLPIEAAIQLLQRLDTHKLHVHYVTARTAVCQSATETFITTNRLPCAGNVRFCPGFLGSSEHKRRQHSSLQKEYEVIASIGDSAEEEEASIAARIPFIAVDPCNPAVAWSTLAVRIAQFDCL